MVDIDAAGGAATGGLIAGAVERPTGAAGEARHSCSDCGEPVSDKFCSNCGQPTHVHRSLIHLGEEVLHGVMHFDARIWRTLPLLLLNPGRLTREWIQGKRTRYVSPLALFLFTVFLMFFLLSFGGTNLVTEQPLAERMAVVQADIESERAAVAQALATLTAAQTAANASPVTRDAAATLETASDDFAEAVDDLANRTDDLARLQNVLASGPREDGLRPGSWQAEIADSVRDGRVNIGVGDKKMREKILNKLANPDFAVYKVQQTLYKFAFLLVPLSIPFVWLLFAWKRGFTWYDHGVFVLYSLTFMAILMMTLIALDAIAGNAQDWREMLGGAIGSLLTFAVPVHMYAQLKGTYGLSIWSALWRTFVLLILSFSVMIIFVLAIILLGLGA